MKNYYFLFIIFRHFYSLLFGLTVNELLDLGRFDQSRLYVCDLLPSLGLKLVLQLRDEWWRLACLGLAL